MSNKNTVSIIIPTFNRDQLLSKTLIRLGKQTYSKRLYEIIIIDDDRKDTTKRVISILKKQCDLNIKYYPNTKKGRATAKNFGISKSKRELLIFLDDDILVKKDFVEQHVKYYLKYGQISIGKIISSKTAKLTNFEKFISSGTFIKTDLQLRNLLFFHSTANLSIPRKFLKTNKFDEHITKYGYEDLDLGFRLFEAGYKLYYNPRAFGIHSYHNTFEQFCKNKYEAGMNLSYLITKNPSITKHINIPSCFLFKIKFAFSIILPLIQLIPDQLMPIKFYKLIIGYYFMKGFKENQVRIHL